MNEEGPSPREIAFVQRLERWRASAAKNRQALGDLVLARVCSGIWHTTTANATIRTPESTLSAFRISVPTSLCPRSINVSRIMGTLAGINPATF